MIQAVSAGLRGGGAGAGSMGGSKKSEIISIPRSRTPVLSFRLRVRYPAIFSFIFMPQF
jgi:hypothetical protein